MKYKIAFISHYLTKDHTILKMGMDAINKFKAGEKKLHLKFLHYR